VDLTQKSYKYTPVRFWNLIPAKFVLEHVKRIFRGVRDSNPGGWCFTGRPPSWYIRKRVEVPFPSDKVFAVYMNPHMRVYECRAEYVSDDDDMCPINWRDRYGRLVWKDISLADSVEGSAEFRAEPWYNRYGDCIVFQMKDEAVVADRIDEILTIYRSAIDDKPIGYQIKSVHALIRRIGLEGLACESVSTDDELLTVSISGPLLAAYEEGRGTLSRRAGYTTAIEKSGSPAVQIPKAELAPAYGA